jgi:predicted enzyme related to lactoylglutathione lyase
MLIDIRSMPNPLIHWELMVSDPERTKTFYARVFDWTFVPAGPEYTLVQAGAEPNGGLMRRPPGVPHSALNSYFRVADLDRTLRDAVEAGATVIVPRMEVPGIGWFAMFLDLDQIPIGIMQLR